MAKYDVRLLFTAHYLRARYRVGCVFILSLRSYRSAARHVLHAAALAAFFCRSCFSFTMGAMSGANGHQQVMPRATSDLISMPPAYLR